MNAREFSQSTTNKLILFRSSFAYFSFKKSRLFGLAERTAVMLFFCFSGLNDAFALNSVLFGEVHSALLVNAEELDLDNVAFADNVLNLLNAEVFELGDVNHTFLTGSKFNESSDRNDLCNLTLVDSADLGLEYDALDDLLSSESAVAVDRGDEYATVVLDIDLSAGISDDLLNNLTARTDNFSDLIGMDVHGDHLGSVRRYLVARTGDSLENVLVDDVVSTLMSNLECLLDDLGCKTVDLEVHLNGCDTLVSTCYLEVHIAVKVLKSLNVDHCGPRTVLLGDKTAGDTCNGSCDRNTCVHKSEGGTANGCLRCGTVRGNHLGNATDGVGELVDSRKYGEQRTLCESAVTDLAASGRTGSLSLTCGEAGHIVVVDISLLSLLVDIVEELNLADRTKRTNCKNLSLTSGEHTAAVNSRNESYLCVERTDLVHSSAVNTLLVNEQPAADDLLLELVDKLFHNIGYLGILLGELLDDSVLDRLNSCVTDGLVVGVKSEHKILFAECEDLVEHVVVKLARGIVELGLADLCNDTVDECAELLDLLVSGHDSAEHNVVSNFLRACLDHNDLLKRTCNGQLEVALLTLLEIGVDDDVSVNQTNVNACDRSVPRNVGDGKSDGCAEHSCDLRLAVGLDGENEEIDSYVVTKILGEKRTDRSVYNS